LRARKWHGRHDRPRFLLAVVIIMTIAMVHAGVLTFAQALGIVLGANIGTTIGGQIIAFDVAKYAPAFLLIGLLVHFFGSGDRWKNWGSSRDWRRTDLFRT
jgi:phosphate:Na+ symporter